MKFNKPKFWDNNRQTIFSLVLFPLSVIVYFVTKLKRLKKGEKFKFPIICVGNIYLGGTGKTPISIEIFKIILPFLIILTVLVFIHEMGHYLVARKNGVKVEVFAIGFGSCLLYTSPSPRDRG